jgi:hypothetical protein
MAQLHQALGRPATGKWLASTEIPAAASCSAAANRGDGSSAAVN